MNFFTTDDSSCQAERGASQVSMTSQQQQGNYHPTEEKAKASSVESESFSDEFWFSEFPMQSPKRYTPNHHLPSPYNINYQSQNLTSGLTMTEDTRSVHPFDLQAPSLFERDHSDICFSQSHLESGLLDDTSLFLPLYSHYTDASTSPSSSLNSHTNDSHESNPLLEDIHAPPHTQAPSRMSCHSTVAVRTEQQKKNEKPRASRRRVRESQANTQDHTPETCKSPGSIPTITFVRDDGHATNQHASRLENVAQKRFWTEGQEERVGKSQKRSRPAHNEVKIFTWSPQGEFPATTQDTGIITETTPKHIQAASPTTDCKKNHKPFIEYCNYIRPLIRRRNPFVSNHELMKLIGDSWKELPEREKESFRRPFPMPFGFVDETSDVPALCKRKDPEYRTSSQ